MRRSTQVAAPLLALAASAIISGCRKPEMRRCVDEHNVVVDESFCSNQPNTQQPRSDGHGGFLPFFVPYRYYYGGYGGFGPGTAVGGGAYVPSPGHTYTNSTGGRSGTSRGGFGSSFSSGGAHGGATGE